MISNSTIVRFFVGIFVVVSTTTTTTLLTASALSNNAPSTYERRSFFRVVATTATAAVTTTAGTIISPSQPSFALDMDAFMNQELSKDNNKETQQQQNNKNNDDATMCRYGAPGQETGDACIRAGLPTTRKTGVDAYGKIDRGDYIRCTTSYKIENDRYMKIVTCQDKNRSYVKDKCVAKGAGCI